MRPVPNGLRPKGNLAACGRMSILVPPVYFDSSGLKSAALGSHKAAILQNHGLLTVGHTVDEAVWWFITMDRSCQAQLMSEQVGAPIAIPHETALHTRQVMGAHMSGWFQFQPLYRWIVKLEPDLLD